MRFDIKRTSSVFHLLFFLGRVLEPRSQGRGGGAVEEGEGGRGEEERGQLGHNTVINTTWTTVMTIVTTCSLAGPG